MPSLLCTSWLTFCWGVGMGGLQKRKKRKESDYQQREKKITNKRYTTTSNAKETNTKPLGLILTGWRKYSFVPVARFTKQPLLKVMGSNPVWAWIFFQALFQLYFSSVHNCEDRLYSFLQPQCTYMIFTVTIHHLLNLRFEISSFHYSLNR